MFSLFYLYIIRNDDNKDDQSINQFYVHAQNIISMFIGHWI